jgi:hypothetical protein
VEGDDVAAVASLPDVDGAESDYEMETGWDQIDI